MKRHVLIAIGLLTASHVALATNIVTGTNYQSPYCGCCKDWVKHMEENGFKLEIKYQQDLTPTKTKLGIRPGYASCHTAEIEGYTFEGHVPAEEIKRFLAEKPTDLVGLATPGMPMGSPGMEYNDQKDPYNVVAFDKDGNTRVWSRHNQ
ncbi:DUF411 domain-containing protein [Photobacterium atrarenae]|uniref:DUF411 domain-containing protein n=1 Tax=Photobacterium atrarenae TaxID=865757 RepID=A0ABY5GIP3_9GAMM|nr:DUF411 domain-containing protein [Photobacterium atrarenae]UTV29072.1 DUF411 domain-containing protein [Photobacterium atrarenae]